MASLYDRLHGIATYNVPLAAKNGVNRAVAGYQSKNKIGGDNQLEGAVTAVKDFFTPQRAYAAANQSNDNRLDYSTPVPQSISAQDTGLPQDLNAFSTSGGTGGNNTQGQIYYVNGVPYDTSTAQGRQAFFLARNALIDAQMGQDINAFTDQTKEAQRQADQQYARQYAGIGNDLNTLRQNFADYNTQYGQNVGDVNQGYDVGTVNRANAFAAYSPNAYQSAQGSSQQYAQGKRDSALQDLATAKDRTYQNFNQQELGLNQDLGDLGTNYNAFKTNTAKALTDYQNYLNQFYGNQRDQLQGDLTNADRGQGINAFNYNRTTPGGGLQTVNTDLSGYTPYLNFQALQGSPDANAFSTFKPTITTQTNQSPLDQYLGYQDPTKQKKQPTYV